MKTETLEFNTSNGAAKAFAASPENTENQKAVILIHEWWGLNDQIKKTAERYANEGVTAIAPDLYRGKLAADPDEAAQLMADLEIDDGLETIRAAISTAQENYGNSNFGISGYCMGGTFALQAACKVEGINAAAPYYGDIPTESELENLSIPVIFISAKQDAWINPEKVGELEFAAEKFDLDVEFISYDADHAFANSTRPEVYDQNAADDAWKRVLNFFNDKL